MKQLWAAMAICGLVACGGGQRSEPGGGNRDMSDDTTADLSEPVANACEEVVCDSPPADVCSSSDVLRTYVGEGTCKAGICKYNFSEHTCAGLCANAKCKAAADPCLNVVCDSPPADSCSSLYTSHTYAATGTCDKGTCVYLADDLPCDNTPPVTCATITRSSLHHSGTCVSGACTYEPWPLACPTTSSTGCVDAKTMVTYTRDGSCSAGVCQQSSANTTCMYGCSADAKACRTHPSRMFVTRGTFNGNFGPSSQNGTCNDAAAAAGLDGKWYAWLSDPHDGVRPFDDVGPWYAMDGTTKLFQNKAQLGGFPSAPITLDEYGVAVESGATVWTGLSITFKEASTCYAWNCFDGCSASSTAYKGTYGQTGVTTQAWTDAMAGDCSIKRHLYCIEQ